MDDPFLVSRAVSKPSNRSQVFEEKTLHRAPRLMKPFQNLRTGLRYLRCHIRVFGLFVIQGFKTFEQVSGI